MKNITKMIFWVSAFFSKFAKLFGYNSKKNPYTLTDHEKRKQYKKSKGGGKRRGFITGLPKSSHYIATMKRAAK